jgi:hypothetical protein
MRQSCAWQTRIITCQCNILYQGPVLISLDNEVVDRSPGTPYPRVDRQGPSEANKLCSGCRRGNRSWCPGQVDSLQMTPK